MPKRVLETARPDCPCHCSIGPTMTYAEAGQFFRVHPKTIRDWADEGRLVKVALGPQTLRVTRESVEALLKRSIQA